MPRDRDVVATAQQHGHTRVDPLRQQLQQRLLQRVLDGWILALRLNNFRNPWRIVRHFGQTKTIQARVKTSRRTGQRRRLAAAHPTGLVHEPQRRPVTPRDGAMRSHHGRLQGAPPALDLERDDLHAATPAASSKP